MMERLLTIDQTAATLALSRSTIYRMVRRGELPVVTVAGRKRIPRSAVERLSAPQHEEIGGS